MLVVGWTFLLYLTCAASVIDASSSQSSTVLNASAATDEIGEPLLLTPLIDAGNLSEARNASRATPLLDNVESYAGFFTVNRTTRSHLHFWFVPRTIGDGGTASPLFVYLGTANALFGALNENGPYRRIGQRLQRRHHAWTDHYHMLYVDALVGVGYSFTEGGGFVGSHSEVGRYIYEALRQFYELFPEFRASDLYVAGDEGTFVPAAGHKIHAANAEVGALKMPLKGVVIGNGISGSEEAKIFYAAHLHSVGLIDTRERLQLEAILESMRYAVRSGNWTLAADEEVKLKQRVFSMVGEISPHDYTRDMSDLVELKEGHREFVTRNDVRRSLHVGGVKYDSDTAAAWSALRQNFGRPVRALIEELLQRDYKTLFYNGQFDLSSSHLVSRKFLERLSWHGAYEYHWTEKRIWRVGNSVAGYYTVARNLAYVMVRNAGHLVSSDQPKNALSMIDSFVEKEMKNEAKWSLGDE